MSVLRALLWVGIMLAGLSACSSGPNVFVQQDPGTDMYSFRTYRFADRLSTDRPDGATSLESQALTDSVRRQMNARGFKETQGPADLRINFYIHTKEKIDVRQTPSTGGYYGYRGARYGVYGGYDTTVRQYTEGTLTVDMINESKGMLAWEGTIQGRIKSSDQKRPLRVRADEAIADMFSSFPYTAGRGPYTPPERK